MRPFVPAAPARPPRGRRRPAPPEGSRRFPWPRTGAAEPERTQVAAPPLAAPAAGPGEVDAAAVRRRVAEARASAADGAEPPLAPLIAEALDAPIDDPRVAALVDELDGFGPLAPWVRTPGVTDVLVDGAGAVWTDGDEGLVRRPGRLDPETARALAVRLLHRAGRRLDAAVPLADARVGRVRVHAVLPPVSGDGTLLSLRIPAATTPSLTALADGWPDGALWADALEALVRDRATVLVSGATGAGKTTLLSAALGRVPGTNGSSSWRTRPRPRPITRTWSPCSAAPPTRRAPARSDWPSSSATRCGCGRTGSWSASAAAPRWPTSSPP